ncbi:MAG: signal peptidase I [Chloroflexota bacterium]|nr:signal peptidase I [Chloroflexota bacterium]
MRTAIREITITVLLAVAFFLIISSAAHSAEVQGFSMEPNLHDGQRVIVSKAKYWFDNPQRGDIVVFESSRTEKDIIHRIVGMPGEWIEISRGELYVNGEKLGEPYLRGSSITAPLKQIPDNCYFIVGDNRGAARWDIVPEEAIVGKAWFCYWPLSDWGSVENYSW